MSAGPTPQQISVAKSKAKSALEHKLKKAVPGLTFSRHGIGNARVYIDYRLIRASNGEACGWAVARVFHLVDGLPVTSTDFENAPWMSHGATVNDIAEAIRAAQV